MTFVLFIITLLIVAYLVGRIRSLQERTESLERHTNLLSLELGRLKEERKAAPTVTEYEEMPLEEPVFHTPSPVSEPIPSVPEQPPIFAAQPPPLPQAAMSSAEAVPVAPAEPEPAKAAPSPDFNWEQFLGAKMLAWLGGLALFVGIAFFVKYSFDRNLIPPWLRVVAGYAVGAGLVIAGIKIRAKDYLVTAQTFVATGVVILYGVSFIARSLYHLIDTPTLFVLMSAITVGAFTLAIRLDARVVAVLGMLGGFLTPLLVGFSREQPLSLLGYVLVLNCGLLMVARRQNWGFLIPLAALATFITEGAWVLTALQATNLITTLLMIGAITAVFVANVRFNPETETQGGPRSLFAGTLQSVVVLGTFWFLLSQRAEVSSSILLGTLFFGNVALITLYALTLHAVPLVFAVSACGALLALWITKSNSVVSACVAALVYAGLNALLPTWIAKWRDAAKLWPNVASVAGLGMMLLILFSNANPGWFFWTVLLVLNAVLLAIALMRRNMALAVCGTLSTAFLTVYWITHFDPNRSLVQPLLIIGAFALLYFFAAQPLAKDTVDSGRDPKTVYFPAIPAGIPFLLLALLMARFKVENPSMLFGFALLLNCLLIFATPKAASAFPVIALIGTLLIEALWFLDHLTATNAWLGLPWFILFSLFFTAVPLLRKRDSRDWLPRYASAAAGPLHFVFINWTARMLWPENALPGIVPALLGLPALAMFLHTRNGATKAEDFRRFTGIFGGSLLFFITLIFPIQFDRQWLTIGWALEGAALVWLNRRAPAKWLLNTGAVLLVVASARLVANPFIFRYFERSEMPLLNWYLYTYGVVALAAFLAAKWAPREGSHAQLNGWFNGMGTLLLFVLINIEIADLFAEGTYLTFEFSGNFARDMTYSIAWSLFALTLLIVGVRRDAVLVRYAGLGLMGMTLVKLFLHDLTRLDALFRIGAFIGVAIILIFASWLYQRFISTSRKAMNATAK